MALRIIFAGTPAFTLPSLTALLASEHDICAIYTKPDTPSGRGQKLHFSAVKKYLIENNLGIPIYQPATLKNEKAQQELQALGADLMVVIAYGLILPPEVINIPRYGCINVHASLLPRWRGAAPIQRAILAGDKKTGVTIMQINAGLDTGDILLIKPCEIKETDTTETLHERLGILGAKALLELITNLQQKKIAPMPQDDSQATLAPKIKKEEALIDWNLTAAKINQKVRAFIPWPIAYTFLKGEILRLWETKVMEKHVNAKPGTVVGLTDHSINVATADKELQLTKVQLANGKILEVKDFLNARRHWFEVGETRLGT